VAVVVFDPAKFRSIYPDFAGFTDEQLDFAFDVVCQVVDNSERSRIPYRPPAVKTREVVLNLLVCHLCELAKRGAGIVGAMTNASEGSVSAGFSMPADPSDAWFNQTQCGATALQILLGFALGGRLFNGCFR